jgi:hypothetical protein
MYIEIIGRWIDGPVLSSEQTGALAGSIRVPQPIEWPRGEDGVISVRVTDEDDQPLNLNLPTDTITMYVGWDFRSGARLTVVGTAGEDPGQYLFLMPSNSTIDLSGPLVYDVRAVFGGLQQQVCPPAYFTATPEVMSL